MTDTLNIANTALYAGQTVEWTESLPSYPASNFDAQCIFKYKSDSIITINGVASGDDFQFTQPATVNKSGEYKVQVLILQKDTTNLLDASAYVTVNVSALLSAESDARTNNEIILDALWEVQLGRATREQSELELPNGTKIKYLSPKELREEISIYQSAVIKEKRRAAGLPTKRNWLPRVNNTL